MQLTLTLFVITAIVLLSSLACAADLSNSGKSYKASALRFALHEEYKDNPVRFEYNYVGKPVSTYGKIKQIDMSGVVYFQDWFGGYRYLTCKFADKTDVISLSDGDKIHITGKVDGATSQFVHLINCQLVDR